MQLRATGRAFHGRANVWRGIRHGRHQSGCDGGYLWVLENKASGINSSKLSAYLEILEIFRVFQRTRIVDDVANSSVRQTGISVR
jgi:hypothetical protein